MRGPAWLACLLAAVLAPRAGAQAVGDLLITQLADSRLEVYAPDGTLKATTLGNGSGNLWIGACFAPGELLVTTRRQPYGVNVFDASGLEIETFNTPEVLSIGDVSAFSDGTLAVVDQSQFDIDLYSGTGQHLGTFSAPGMTSPWGTDIDSNDILWVAANPGIWRFDRSGKHLGTIPTTWQVGEVVSLGDGTVWATEQNAGRIVRLDLAGNELSSFFTGLPNAHWGLAVMPDGTLRVGVLGQTFVGHYAPDGTLLGKLPVPSVWVVFIAVAGPDPTSAVPYCTAKVNSLGCEPAIRAVGFPRASEDFGFIVSASNVRNARPGVLLYTLAGRTIQPFQGGVLCLAQPILRTAPVDSGGAPPPAQDCGGNWRLDMNAFAAGVAGGAPAAGLRVPGTFVHCQWWGRDRADAFGSALTDALQYEIAP